MHEYYLEFLLKKKDDMCWWESSIDTYNLKKWECRPKKITWHLGSNERGPHELFGDKLLVQFDLECVSDNCACIWWYGHLEVYLRAYACMKEVVDPWIEVLV